METSLTTAPSVAFHPNMQCNAIAALFQDLSISQQNEAAAAAKKRKKA